MSNNEIIKRMLADRSKKCTMSIIGEKVNLRIDGVVCLYELLLPTFVPTGVELDVDNKSYTTYVYITISESNDEIIVKFVGDGLDDKIGSLVIGVNGEKLPPPPAEIIVEFCGACGAPMATAEHDCPICDHALCTECLNKGRQCRCARHHGGAR